MQKDKSQNIRKLETRNPKLETRNSKLETRNSKPETKILVAGVGGQGVIFLTNLLVKSALLADIPVATSEVHGLAQRGGSVTASVTLGEHHYGFSEKGGVDILFGLEPLEAQRSASFLNKDSVVIIDNNRILPHSVNSGSVAYPDIDKFIHYLEKNIRKVIYVTENRDSVKAIVRILYVLGRICNETNFPVQADFIEKAIIEITREGYEEKSLEAFRLGLEFKV